MASNDSTYLNATEVVASNLTRGAVLDNQTFSEKLASLPYALYEHRGLLVLESRIVFTALACIYIGSHAALRRPPSARPPKKDKKGASREEDEEEEDDFVQGLVPSDALWFPVLAGTVLVGLYYLIKWLEDPEILNKILRVYFSFMSVASMGKLFADSLHLLTAFVFPTVWTSKGGKLYHIDVTEKGQWHLDKDSGARVWDNKKTTPLPGLWSELKLTDNKIRLLWEVRRLLLGDWSVHLSLHGVVDERSKVKFNDIVGFVLAIGANLIYYNTQSTFFSNIMGYAFTYLGIIMMSPTTFATGSMVLFGLFFYDIYMVFYT
jgi:minor histocompatibility antigen H13